MVGVDLPERMNATKTFVDAHIGEGRGDKTAILCGDEAVTYQQLYENVNRMGNALRGMDVRMEERVAILLPDTPEWVYTFFGAMKIGAVAVPLNTNLKAEDYEYFLDDSRARVLVADASLLGHITDIRAKFLKTILVRQGEAHGCLSLGKNGSASISVTELVRRKSSTSLFPIVLAT